MTIDTKEFRAVLADLHAAYNSGNSVLKREQAFIAHIDAQLAASRAAVLPNDEQIIEALWDAKGIDWRPDVLPKANDNTGYFYSYGQIINVFRALATQAAPTQPQQDQQEHVLPPFAAPAGQHDDCDAAFDKWYAAQSHQLTNEQVCRLIWQRGWQAHERTSTAGAAKGGNTKDNDAGTPAAQGSGVQASTKQQCPNCRGEGVFSKAVMHDFGSGENESTDCPKCRGTGVIYAASPTPSAAPPATFDAEFLSKRLARVAKLTGAHIPEHFTHEQIAEVAGTILGDIARKLEGAAPSQVAQTKTLMCSHCAGRGQAEAPNIPGGWAKCGECSGRGYLAAPVAPSQPQQAGWQMVPVQMTVDMALALHGRDGIEQGPGITCVSDETARLYDAMLAAAPTPPARSAE